MKVNLDKLVELEVKYKESMLATETIQRMIGLVFEKSYGGMNGLVDTVADPSYVMSLTTLKELGIIES